MRVLAIDFGTKRIGLAISDEKQTIANALSTIEVKNNNYMLAIHQIQKLVKYYNNIELILLGYPLMLNDQKSRTTLAVEQFHQLLLKNIDLPVQLIDEQYSTKETISFLKQTAELKGSQIKKIKDKLAAQHLLTKYLEQK
ncbi:MAG: Holliday junction resolvase RuvX [Mycoplasma sp.]